MDGRIFQECVHICLTFSCYDYLVIEFGIVAMDSIVKVRHCGIDGIEAPRHRVQVQTCFLRGLSYTPKTPKPSGLPEISYTAQLPSP